MGAVGGWKGLVAGATGDDVIVGLGGFVVAPPIGPARGFAIPAAGLLTEEVTRVDDDGGSGLGAVI